MKVGRLRHYVTLQRRQDQVVNGEVVLAWVDLANVWAGIEPLSGREFFAAQQINSDATVRIQIRWRDDVDSTTRVKHQITHDSPARFDYYDVSAVLADPVITRRWLTLVCVKRDSESFRSGE